MVTLLIILMAYVIGAIPIAYLVGRLSGHDLLKEGSGGVSGSAAIERLGLIRGSCAGFFDALKPVAVVLITQRISVYDVSAIAAVAAVVGHIWPVTLRFRGGSGCWSGRRRIGRARSLANRDCFSGSITGPSNSQGLRAWGDHGICCDSYLYQPNLAVFNSYLYVLASSRCTRNRSFNRLSKVIRDNWQVNWRDDLAEAVI
jgi:hypothetical protein